MFLFYAKKIVARALFPLPLTLMLLVAGAVLLLRRPRRSSRWAAWRRGCGIGCVAAAAVLLAVGGFGGMRLLELYCGGLAPLTARDLALPGASWVIGVTSAGGFAADDTEVEERRMDPEARLRLDEGCRLFTECERAGIPCRLAVSLGNVSQEERRCAAVRAACLRYGIAPGRVVCVPGVRNSRDEVRRFAEIPGRLIVVSKAAHLPRLLRLARSLGRPDTLASPYGSVPRRIRLVSDPLDFVPSAKNFEAFETLVYEMLGQAEILLFH